MTNGLMVNESNVNGPRVDGSKGHAALKSSLSGMQFMGIPDNNKNTYGGDTILTSIRKRGNHPNRGRAHELPCGEL